MKKVIPILMSLILLAGMLISPATAQLTGEDVTIKGEQVKIASSVRLETNDYLISTSNPNAEDEGGVEFTDLKMPVVVGPTAETPILTLDPTEIDTIQAPDTQITKTLSIGNQGGVILDWSILEAPARAYNLDFGGGNKSGSRPVSPVTDDRPVIEAMGEHASVETVLPENTINANLVLALDDGSAENSIGFLSGNREIIFLNRFTPDPAVFPLTLNEILVYFDGEDTNVQPGDEISLVVYENTSGSTDPAVGSSLLHQQSATVGTVDSWNEYTLTTPVVLNGPGDVLIGVIALETPGILYFPAAIDLTTSQQRSWIGYWEDSPPPTPPTLPPTDTWDLIDNLGYPGNWLIRGLATYDPCDNPADVQWLSLDKTSGYVIPGGLDEVTVTTDSTGMTTGVYSANLCLYSNDPLAELTVVPVTMKVSDLCITVEPTSLEQTLPINDSATQTLTLRNRCVYDADFEITELLFEGFEGGVMPPAGGWETFHRGTTDEEWIIYEKNYLPEYVYEGEYAAWVNYDEYANSDEWLLTPVIDATTLVDLELSFMAISNTGWPDATMKLWATDAAGVPLTTEPLWDMVRDETWNDGFYYREVIVDLSAYEGMNEIRLAWQYVGIDGNSFGLDNIRLTSAADNIPWLSENPLTGSVPANSTLDVTVTFDSTGMAPGDYYGLLKVINPPYNDIDVPVTLHVISGSLSLYLYLPLIFKQP